MKRKTIYSRNREITFELKSFKQTYNASYAKKIEYFKEKYPEITSLNRRTGKALKNIYFFIWYYAKEEKEEVIDLLFKSSVLLSAQDDFCDNLHLSNQKKRKFYDVCSDLLEGKDYRYRISNETLQFQELVQLWREVIKNIRATSPALYTHWKKEAEQFNDAMDKEQVILKSRNIGFEKYMRTATYSIGVIFILTTYLVGKNISIHILQSLQPILLRSAKIARLSNDIASDRVNKNKINVVSIIQKSKNPRSYVLNKIKRENKKMYKDIQCSNIEKENKEAIQKFTNFLIQFYKEFDFDKSLS